MTESEDGKPKNPETSGLTLFVVWIIILALGAFSLVMRFAHIGSFTFLTGFSVAVIQATLVVLYFMEAIHERITVHAAFIACLSLLAILIVLMVADVLTRATPPLTDPPGTGQRYRG